jgi:hypothetical protein
MIWPHRLMPWADSCPLPDNLLSGLNYRVVDLAEFFGVARVVILVHWSRLELVGPSDLPEPWRQSTGCTTP